MSVVILLFAASFSAFAALLLIGALAYVFGGRNERLLPSYFVLAPFFLSAICVALSVPSSFSIFLGNGAGGIVAIAGLTVKAMQLIFVVACSIGLLRFFLLRSASPSTLSYGADETNIKWFWYSIAALLVASMLSAVFGSKPVQLWSGDFRKELYFPAALLTLWVLRGSVGRGDLVLYFCRFVNAISVLNLILWVLARNSVMTRGTAYLDGLSERMGGILGTPTTTGYVAGAAVIAIMVSPGLFRGYRWFWISVNFLVILLAQAKASILCVLIISLIYWLYLRQESRAMKFVGLVVVLLLSSVVYYLLSTLMVGMTSSALNEVSTFTGRARIWEITIDAWKENLLFGYGPLLWGEDFRRLYAPPHLYEIVGMAHNQFIQTLGQAGLIGFFGLIVHLLVVGRLVLKSAVRGDLLGVCLFFYIIVRCITEAPFLNTTISANSLVLLLLYFSFILRSSSSQLRRA
jgi:exopolysaccharide production protein ExoQ